MAAKKRQNKKQKVKHSQLPLYIALFLLITTSIAGIITLYEKYYQFPSNSNEIKQQTQLTESPYFKRQQPATGAFNRSILDKSVFSESILTEGEFSIGQKSYVLLGRSYGMDFTEYVLQGISDDKKEIILYRGSYNGCQAPDVDKSPNNTKFIISYYCGDAPVKFIIGVNDVNNLTPIPKMDAKLNERYTSVMTVIKWVDETSFIVENYQWSTSSDFKKTTLWLVSYPDFNFIKEIDNQE